MEINLCPTLRPARVCWWGDATPAIDLQGDTLFFSSQAVLSPQSNQISGQISLYRKTQEEDRSIYHTET